MSDLSQFRGPRLLAPPYAHFEPPHPLAPLGSVLLGDTGDDAGTLQQLSAYAQLLPWCPVALVVRDTVPARDLLARLPDHVAFIAPHAGMPFTPRVVLDAVTSRPPLSPDLFAAWVARRIGREGIAPLLASAIDTPPRTGLAALASGYALLRARLLQLGPLTPGDWRMAYFLAACAGHPAMSIEGCAERLRTDAWTIRMQVERLAGATLDEQRAQRGWEWFAESVLRKWGYVIRHQPAAAQAAREAR